MRGAVRADLKTVLRIFYQFKDVKNFEEQRFLKYLGSNFMQIRHSDLAKSKKTLDQISPRLTNQMYWKLTKIFFWVIKSYKMSTRFFNVFDRYLGSHSIKQ